MLDLSAARLSPEEVAALITNCAYQPFKLPGDIYTGAGLSFTRPTPLRHIAATDSHPDRNAFIEETKRQAQMYEDLIGYLIRPLGSIAGMTYLDVACNAGYFCQRLAQLGVARSVGVDVGDYAPAFTLANRSLNTAAEFFRGSYDMHTHTLSGVEGEFDIVSNIAFMCHSSDPTFLLEALAKRAKKALLIFSKFSRDDEYRITYPQATSRYFGGKFPTCFDAQTEMSDSLLRFGLKELGFAQILEVPRRDTWLPRPPSWRAFVALR